MHFGYLVGLIALAIAVPANAQSGKPIAAPADAPWTHAQTGTLLPATMLGIPRDALVDNTTSQIDVIADYRDDQPTAITVFLFRPAVQSVPLWFDRAEAQILLRDVYGNAAPATAIAAFIPPHATTASGLRRTYLPSAGVFKSTGLAVLPLGEWLVAIRISSQSPDTTALSAKLDEVIKAIGWPDRVPDAPVAVPIVACAKSLTFAVNAKMKAPDMSDAILGAALASVVPTDAQKAQAKAVVWCRDGVATSAYGTYRSDEDDDGYLMAMGDAGRIIEVTPGIALSKKKPGYRVSLGLLDQTLIYPSFDKLPAPDAVLGAVSKASPVSSTMRGGKDVTMTISPSKKK